MNDFNIQSLERFFQSIEGWKEAYKGMRLHILGLRSAGVLEVISARLVLDIGADVHFKPPFQIGSLEAYQVPINPAEQMAQGLAEALLSEDGLSYEGIGHIKLTMSHQVDVFVAPPALLHPEGLRAGNRLSVLSVLGGNVGSLLPQPETDWMLKAAPLPYDSLHELLADYGLSLNSDSRALFEVVARTAVQVAAESKMSKSRATTGVWLAKSLKRERAALGYRVIRGRDVIQRGSIVGDKLNWEDREHGSVGLSELEVPEGSVMQCFATYAGQAHHMFWLADPETPLNPRMAVMSLVDPTQMLMKSFLDPSYPPRGKAAPDFEAAVGWMLWTLGFSVASFGTHPKTTDAFDVVASTPKGHLMVVECTIGMLRLEGKLSRLVARAGLVRGALSSANLGHLTVLPVIVTALPKAMVAADTPAAVESGVLVLCREDLDQLQIEMLGFPDADQLFDRGLQALQQRRLASAAQQAGQAQPSLDLTKR